MLHPKETFAEQKSKASWRSALVPLAIAIFLLFFANFMANVLFEPQSSSEGPFFLVGLAVGSVFGILLVFGVLFVSTFVTYEIAVLLGSKCDYKTHLYVTSLIVVPLLLVEVPLVFVYALLKTKDLNVTNYLSLAYQFVAYREIHGFSTARTIALFGIAFFIAVIAVIFLYAGLSLAAPDLVKSLVSAS